MDLGLKGKVMMVAAASKGLGFGVAQALAREGAKVSMCSRDQKAIDEAAMRLTRETNAETLGVACDVTQAADIQKWVDLTAEKWGTIDGLLVNAGGPPAGNLVDMTDEQWQGAFDLTLMSTVRMIRSALPHMPSGGAIVTVTSSSVREYTPRLGLSTVMRLGVVGVVKTLSVELAEDGIRINNIIPGRIHTDRTDHLDRITAEKAGITFEEAHARSAASIPMKRLGNIEEFGKAAAFLLSPAASYISGAALQVDGAKITAI